MGFDFFFVAFLDTMLNSAILFWLVPANIAQGFVLESVFLWVYHLNPSYRNWISFNLEDI